MGIDSLLIVLSYTLILHTVMRLASPRERIRALNTCVSHILAVLVFFIPVIGVSMIHRFGRHLSPIVHSLFCLRVPGGAPCAQPRHLQCQVQAHQGGHALGAEEEMPELMMPDAYNIGGLEESLANQNFNSWIDQVPP